MTMPDISSFFIFGTSLFGIFYAFYQFRLVKKTELPSLTGEMSGKMDQTTPLAGGDVDSSNMKKAFRKVRQIYEAIQRGANVFLFAEYKVMAIFIVLFGSIILFLVGGADTCGAEKLVSSSVAGADCPADAVKTWADSGKGTAGPEGCAWVANQPGSCWERGWMSLIAFVVGGVTSILSGWIGMRIAVYGNARTTLACQGSKGWSSGFNTAFRAGAVMGFSLCGMGLLTLYLTILAFNNVIPYDGERGNVEALFECIAGFGLGGSAIAMFGRVGGGIYTKAADVGADLVGKVENAMDEDDVRNCATIADNVGDNVGDVAGMGADLFGSFGEATCAALVVASTSPQLAASWPALMYPLHISGMGILVCFASSLFALSPAFAVQNAAGVFRALKNQLWISTLFMTPATAVLSWYALPAGEFCVKMAINRIDCAPDGMSTWFHCFLCVMSGLWGGLIIGLITEYMTSYEHRPTQEVAESTETGAATNIIFGLSLGYKSVIVPIVALALAIFTSFSMAGLLGVALSALGMLSTLAICLSIDVYGPICDNAGGIAEMAGMPEYVRERTDVLDAAGNTTAAIGKGFAIGSAALVSLALFGAFVSRANIEHVDILKPITFSGLLIGAMLPYWFTAMTMKSVGLAAKEMVLTVRRIFKENERSLFRTDVDGKLVLDSNGDKICIEESDPKYVDPLNIKGYYDAPIAVSTEASLREMLLPGALVMFAPLVIGFLFGADCVTGLLAGAMTSGVQMAISQSNTGGAWDNAKKYIESGQLTFDGVVQQKGSDAHKAAVIGDTVGDPLKDTSGPALNILMKLMAIISLVFAPFFVSHSICHSTMTC